jgi:hypothetical protein
MKGPILGAVFLAVLLAVRCTTEAKPVPTPSPVPTSSAVSMNSREFIMNERWRELAEAACSQGYSDATKGARSGEDWRCGQIV